MEPETRAWWVALGRMLALLLAGLLLGLAFGRPYAGLALTLAGALAWQLVNLFRLDWWLRGRSAREPPDMGGLWGEVMSQVVRLHRRKRYHKQKLVQLAREIRHSTAAMPEGVVVLNAHGEILWFNRMAGRLLGLRRKVDFGLRVANLLRNPEFGRYLEHGDFSQPLTVTPLTGTGPSLSVQVVPYGSDQRLMLVRDVTREVQLESLRKEFVANASHELRSPLTVISGYLEAIEQDEALDPALRPPLQEMRRQAERMNGIVHDLLELSRLEAVDEEVGGDEIDVRALAALLRKDVLARPRHPQVTLALETAARLRGDEPEIHSAFSNLVDNAVKYTPADGQIHIRWWVDEPSREACFSVRDTGIGIPAEHIPRLTERFYRVDEGRSRARGGSGLGLAIVKHVLQHHGGRLEIQSTPGKGSTFTCRFPAQRVLPAPDTADMLAAGRADARAP